MEETAATPTAAYKDDDLVYVDPDKREVVGLVEWSQNGRPKSMSVKKLEDGDEEDGRRRRRKYYPWGTYRSMKRIYKLEGRVPRQESGITLDQAIEKAMKEPFWD